LRNKAVHPERRYAGAVVVDAVGMVSGECGPAVMSRPAAATVGSEELSQMNPTRGFAILLHQFINNSNGCYAM